MGWEESERGTFEHSRHHGEAYKAIAQTICPNVFEAFAAHALWAMGIEAPQQRRQGQPSVKVLQKQEHGFPVYYYKAVDAA